MRPTILIAESSKFSEVAAKRLRDAGRVILSDLDRQGLLSAATEADVLWVRLRHRIDREVMSAAPHLRVIATPTTGLNHIDLEEAQRRNIRVISLQGETEFLRNVYATAEHTMALIFALIRRLPAACEHVTSGGWNRDLFIGQELHGKTAGVIGYGRVGRMVARYLHAMGMNVQVTDPLMDAKTLESGLEAAPYMDLLRTSDLVTLHVSLNDGTRSFFGPREFSQMKRGAYFINTSRGELVDEGALIQSLDDGQIAAVALDVLCDEHSSGMGRSPLVEYARHHSNLLITPHIGGCTAESREKTENFLANQVATFLESQSKEVCVETGNWKDVS